MSEYYVADGDERRGPFSVAQLVARIVPLTPATLVWRRGMSGWAEASHVPELSSALHAENDEPPPYQPVTPSTGDPIAVPKIPKWIIGYSVAVTPILWLFQRGCNVISLMSESKDPEINSMVLFLAVWAVVTLVVAGVVVLGGLRAPDHPERRTAVLRIALGASFMLGMAATAFGFISVGIAIAHQHEAQATTDDDLTGYAVLAAAALCLIQAVLDAAAWIRLGRTRS